MIASHTYVPVAGTHDWAPGTAATRWWQAASPFTQMMRRLGLDRAGQEWPFWSTALAGTVFAGRTRRVWWHGAYVLATFLKTLPLEDRNLIALSHGGQVAAIAASRLVPVRTLVTVCTPVRRDLDDVYRVVQARWLHLYCVGWSNRLQFLGQRVRLRWQMPAPAVNKRLKQIGHSDLLRDPDEFEDVYREVIAPFLSQTTA